MPGLSTIYSVCIADVEVRFLLPENGVFCCVLVLFNLADFKNDGTATHQTSRNDNGDKTNSGKPCRDEKRTERTGPPPMRYLTENHAKSSV